MPLTNVWTQDRTGEWVRTTATAMDREYDYTVSVSSRTFRCYNCFQYVTFVKGNEYRISHFKHSRGEEDKDCEDRSTGTGGYVYGTGITDVPDPMRIQLDGSRAYLEIGFFPVSAATIEKAIHEKMMISISGLSGSPDVYYVDWSRFEPHSMTWLRLPFSWALKYSVKIEPSINAVKTWDIHRTPLLKYGTVFDAATGKRIPEKSDISVGREYYIVCDKWKSFYSRSGVQISPKTAINDQWCLYRMTIPSYNDNAADFCFEAFHLRLTTQPSDIQLLWPPAVEGDDLIDTNQKQLYLFVKGESDFETYPSYGTRNKAIFDIDKNKKIVELSIISTLQMVSTSRYNQRLRFLYIRPWEASSGYFDPDFRVLDDQDREIPDELKTIPPRGIIRILSEVDATVNVEDQDGFLYRMDVTAGQEARLQELKRGMRITIRQGMEILRKIEIGTQKKQKTVINEEALVPWRGRLVPMPRRYAWVLTKMDHSGELYRRTTKALKDGEIPLDGLQVLNKIAEGVRHG